MTDSWTREGGVGRGRKTVPFEDTRPCTRPAHDRQTNQNEESEGKAHRIEAPSQQQKTVACSA